MEKLIIYFVTFVVGFLFGMSVMILLVASRGSEMESVEQSEEEK